MGILCIGNSHVNTFSNRPNLTLEFKNEFFEGRHIGPVIAYNFLEHHLDKVLSIYHSSDIYADYRLSLIAGEVDCRLHIPIHSDKEKISDEEMTFQCVNRFFLCYEKLLSMGIKCIAFSTHPTTLASHDMHYADRPIYDCWQRRNQICVYWNKYSKQKADSLSIPFISFYENLVGDNNETKMEYFLDYCHLNSEKVMPFIITSLKANALI